MRFTNYFDHPADNRYTVYQYHLTEHADYFEELLRDRDVPFERFLDTESGDPKILFGIKKTFYSEAMYCNNMCHAKYRKPFIPVKWLRYALLIFVFGMIGLAIWGFIRSGQ